jgi:hypothetical protein
MDQAMNRIVLEDQMTQTRKDAKDWWNKVVLDEYYREKKIPISEDEARRLGEFLHIAVSVELKKP